MPDLPIKDKPPHNVNVLERWLGEASKQSGVAAGRLRRWLGFMIVAAMLDEARHADDGEPLFLVKGGVAMELRVDAGARATKDLDTAFRESIEAVTDYLDPPLRRGHGDFTATRTELEPVKDTGAVRCDIKLAYRGKSVITVKMEVAAVEGGMVDEIEHVPAKSLDQVGLTGPYTIPCVAVRWQIAQKLHACTEAFTDGENDRFRDLIDLQQVLALEDDDAPPGLRRRVAERVAQLESAADDRRATLARLRVEAAADEPTFDDVEAVLASMPVSGSDLRSLPQPELRMLFDSLNLDVTFHHEKGKADIQVTLWRGQPNGADAVTSDRPPPGRIHEEVWIAPPAGHNANLSPVVPGPIVTLAARHAKVRRDGYRR